MADDDKPSFQIAFRDSSVEKLEAMRAPPDIFLTLLKHAREMYPGKIPARVDLVIRLEWEDA